MLDCSVFVELLNLRFRMKSANVAVTRREG